MGYRAAGSLPIGIHYGAPSGALPALFACSFSGRIDASFDGGLTWATVDSPAAQIGTVQVSSELGRVIAPQFSGGATLRYSDDGLAWQDGVQPLAAGWQQCRYGGPSGDRAFVMLRQSGADVVVAKSSSGIAGWADVTIAGISSPVLFWDDVRQLWCIAAGDGVSFVAFTSPDAVTWTLAFTSAPVAMAPRRCYPLGPNDRAFLAHNQGNGDSFYADAALLDAWTLITYSPQEVRVLAGSPTLFFSSGVGGTNGQVSGTGDAGSWVNVTVPWGIDARFGIYVPELALFVVACGAGGAGDGLWISDSPDLGAGSWTRTEASVGVWDGEVAYGFVG